MKNRLNILRKKKTWDFVYLDPNTLNTHLGPLKTTMIYAKAEEIRELNNRENLNLLGIWSLNIISKFCRGLI